VPIDDSGGGARSTQWATEFLRQGYGVVFVHRFGRDESRDLGLRFSHPDLVAVSLASFDWDLIARRNPGLLDGPRLTGLVEFPLADFLTTIGRMRRDGHPVVYDLLDDWRTSLGGRWYAPEVEREIASAAQVLAATTPGLQERLRELGGGRDVALLPNAVNARLFDPRSVHPRPADLPEAERTLVYIGALWGSWFDWDLIREVALRRPRARVVVIGDCRRPPPSPPSNLDFLGLKPQRDLPAYLSHADACILPWKVDAITRSTSPLKVYECLAMGLPAVAPRLGPLEGMPGVFLADSAAEFVRLAGEARLGPAEREAAAAFVRLNTWSARLEQLMRLVEAVRI
jgi:glycosyltransferase involved in cell wall biosynthesis